MNGVAQARRMPALRQGLNSRAHRAPTTRGMPLRNLARQILELKGDMPINAQPIWKEPMRACLQTTRSAVVEQRVGWRGATKKNTLHGSSTEEQRSQTAFCSTTLRAAGLLAVGGVGSVVTARCGDAPPPPPCPHPKSIAATPRAVFKQALNRPWGYPRQCGHPGGIDEQFQSPDGFLLDRPIKTPLQAGLQKKKSFPQFLLLHVWEQRLKLRRGMLGMKMNTCCDTGPGANPSPHDGPASLQAFEHSPSCVSGMTGFGAEVPCGHQNPLSLFPSHRRGELEAVVPGEFRQ
jgi:hypothetical protein